LTKTHISDISMLNFLSIIRKKRLKEYIMSHMGFKCKRVFLILGILCAVFLSSNTSVYGQWSAVDPSTLPVISPNWQLESIHFTSSNRGWAVGSDFTNQEGVLLLFSNGQWIPIASPVISTNWDLRSVHFPSLTEGWAVGTDFEFRRGVLLHQTSGVWTSVLPPGVSTAWELSGVHFPSVTEGWAVGQDLVARTGVLLHRLNNIWSPFSPLPTVSTDWALFGVHFTSTTQGWAVGRDFTSFAGVLVRFLNGTWTSVIPPVVSLNWSLSSVHFPSLTEGWAVGEDLTNNRGVILHHKNGDWTTVLPPDLPDVSTDWALFSVRFVSPTDGWAVGQDFTNNRGVLLHYDGTTWTSVMPPDAGTDWGLFGLHMIASNDGWAVGQDIDGINRRGVILRYSIPEISVIPKNVNFGDPTIGSYREKIVNITNNGNAKLVLGTITDPALPFTKRLDNCSGKTLVPLQTCSLIYRFQPAAEGDFTSTSDIPSNDPDENPVTVTLTGTGVVGPPLFINLVEPADATHFTACSSFNRPFFRWNPSEPFRPLVIKFSLQPDFAKVPKVVTGKPGVNELQVGALAWNALLRLPGSTGGTVYWKAVGTRTDLTKVESEVFSFIVDGPLPVGNPQIVDTTKSTLPTLSWENNCAKRFTVWFGNNPNFTLLTTKKKYLSYVDADPTDNGGTFTVTLTSRQWSAVRKVVSDTSGSTIYWYVKSRDHLGRRSETSVMNFILTD
jgi:hypothetical protein